MAAMIFKVPPHWEHCPYGLGVAAPPRIEEFLAGLVLGHGAAFLGGDVRRRTYEGSYATTHKDLRHPARGSRVPPGVSRACGSPSRVARVARAVRSRAARVDHGRYLPSAATPALANFSSRSPLPPRR